MEYPNSWDPSRLKWRLGYYRPDSIGSCVYGWRDTHTASDSANGRYNDGFRETMGSEKTVLLDEIASRLKRNEEIEGFNRSGREIWAKIPWRRTKFKTWKGIYSTRRNKFDNNNKFELRSNDSKIRMVSTDRCTCRFDRGAWWKAASCEEFHLSGIEIGFICFV